MKALAVIFLLLITVPGFTMTSTRSIQKVKAESEQSLMEKPCVVSVGIGLTEDRQPAIMVGLDKPCPETVQSLPAEIDGYPVVTQVVSEIKSQ